MELSSSESRRMALTSAVGTASTTASDRRERSQEQGDGQPLQDQLHDRHLEDDGIAEVAAQEMLEEQPELHRDRAVKAQLGIDALHRLVGGVDAEHALVGSPGSRRTRTKMTTMIRKKVGTICANLTTT